MQHGSCSPCGHYVASNADNITVRIFKGSIIHCAKPFKLEVIQDGCLVVHCNKIIHIGYSSTFDKQKRAFPTAEVIEMSNSQILIPGLVDTHIHGPQYSNVGLGYGKTLLDWLAEYTYPTESQLSDLKLANFIFNALVLKTLSYGTTTAAYHSTLYREPSVILADALIKHGQRGFVGRVNILKNAPANYIEPKDISINETRQFIKDVLSKKSEIVKPVISFGFALSVDMNLMTQLAEMAKEFDLNIQTHMAETKQSVQVCEDMYGERFGPVYNKANVLTNKWKKACNARNKESLFSYEIYCVVYNIILAREKNLSKILYDFITINNKRYDDRWRETIVAHGVYLTDEELVLLKTKGTAISHCPGSNTCLQSGMCDVRRLIKSGLKVSLGTDVAGGASPSIIQAMRDAIHVSKHVSIQQKYCDPLSFVDAFYLATLGGAIALAMEDRIGNFIVGKEFDALLVDLDVKNSSADYLMICTPLELLEKFIYLGDDRNVINVFVNGRKVKSPDENGMCTE